MGITRKTKAVKKILSLFEPSVSAVLAVDLITQLKEEMNKTTIYRVLDRLESEGIIHSFISNDGLKWYAKCNNCSSKEHNDIHPHFQCTVCKEVTCLPVEVKIPLVKNYSIENASVFLVGKCNKCSH